jgi:hypothetical protein
MATAILDREIDRPEREERCRTKEVEEPREVETKSRQKRRDGIEPTRGYAPC